MFVQVATQDAAVWDGGEASALRKIGIAGNVSAIARASAMTMTGLFRKMRCAFPIRAGAKPRLACVWVYAAAADRPAVSVMTCWLLLAR